MQAHRSATVVAPALAIIMPRPTLARTSSRSSLSLRSSCPSPRTPSRSSPATTMFLCPGNRKSTDSWNSSVEGDEPEFEWQLDQTLFLSRALDALPAHLLTPFIGSVPPANVLDKLARGVIHAKGAEQWPHSLRATRAKLLHLARSRAKDVHLAARHESIMEEDQDHVPSKDVLRPSTNTPAKRPLYRQSSMDFMQSAQLEGKAKDRISRLSTRSSCVNRSTSGPVLANTLQSSPSYSSSVYCESVRHGMLTSTPSSSTLNSAASVPRSLRRVASVASNSSDSYDRPQMLDPRIQRIRSTESFSSSGSTSSMSGVGIPNIKPRAPTTPTLKQAPSFGAWSAYSSDATRISIGGDTDLTSNSKLGSASSDEEDKARAKNAKKIRVKSPSPTPPPVTPGPTPKLRKAKAQPRSSASKEQMGRKSRADLKRNPSFLGEPIPQIVVEPEVDAVLKAHRPLRRMRATNFGQRATLGKRISFGSLVPPVEEVEMESAPTPTNSQKSVTGVLGSAINLQ